MHIQIVLLLLDLQVALFALLTSLVCGMIDTKT